MASQNDEQQEHDNDQSQAIFNPKNEPRRNSTTKQVSIVNGSNLPTTTTQRSKVSLTPGGPGHHTTVTMASGSRRLKKQGTTDKNELEDHHLGSIKSLLLDPSMPSVVKLEREYSDLEYTLSGRPSKSKSKSRASSISHNTTRNLVSKIPPHKHQLSRKSFQSALDEIGGREINIREIQALKRHSRETTFTELHKIHDDQLMRSSPVTVHSTIDHKARRERNSQETAEDPTSSTAPPPRSFLDPKESDVPPDDKKKHKDKSKSKEKKKSKSKSKSKDKKAKSHPESGDEDNHSSQVSLASTQGSIHDDGKHSVGQVEFYNEIDKKYYPIFPNKDRNTSGGGTDSLTSLATQENTSITSIPGTEVQPGELELAKSSKSRKSDGAFELVPPQYKEGSSKSQTVQDNKVLIDGKTNSSKMSDEQGQKIQKGAESSPGSGEDSKRTVDGDGARSLNQEIEKRGKDGENLEKTGAQGQGGELGMENSSPKKKSPVLKQSDLEVVDEPNKGTTLMEKGKMVPENSPGKDKINIDNLKSAEAQKRGRPTAQSEVTIMSSMTNNDGSTFGSITTFSSWTATSVDSATTTAGDTTTKGTSDVTQSTILAKNSSEAAGIVVDQQINKKSLGAAEEKSKDPAQKRGKYLNTNTAKFSGGVQVDMTESDILHHAETESVDSKYVNKGTVLREMTPSLAQQKEFQPLQVTYTSELNSVKASKGNEPVPVMNVTHNADNKNTFVCDLPPVSQQNNASDDASSTIDLAFSVRVTNRCRCRHDCQDCGRNSQSQGQNQNRKDCVITDVIMHPNSAHPESAAAFPPPGPANNPNPLLNSLLDKFEKSQDAIGRKNSSKVDTDLLMKIILNPELEKQLQGPARETILQYISPLTKFIVDHLPPDILKSQTKMRTKGIHQSAARASIPEEDPQTADNFAFPSIFPQVFSPAGQPDELEESILVKLNRFFASGVVLPVAVPQNQLANQEYGGNSKNTNGVFGADKNQDPLTGGNNGEVQGADNGGTTQPAGQQNANANRKYRPWYFAILDGLDMIQNEYWGDEN